MKESPVQHLMEVEHLRVTYRSVTSETPVLKGVSFTVGEGETVTVVGESGSGKSTIGKALSGLLTPSTKVSGRMRLGDAVYDLADKHLNWQKIRGRAIGHIFQDPHSSLNPRKKIKKQFADILVKGQGLSHEACDARAKELLTLLNFKDAGAVLERYPFQLSGGMCQRVSIALNLSLKPRVMIADEITSALDMKSQYELTALLGTIKETLHTGILFITHDLRLAERISDKILYLSDGTFDDAKTMPRPRTIREMAERPAHPDHPAADGAAPTILKVDHVTKCYHRHKILDGIHFTQQEGEILGILGESGCGKSTLARLIAGIEGDYTGDIVVGDEPVKDRMAREGRRMYRDLQIVFQDERGCLNPYKRVLDIVTEPIRNLRRNVPDPRARAAQYLRMVGLDDALFGRKPPNLSTGQCQRVSLARALAVEPKLLILDEVVSALDHEIKWQIVDLLKKIEAETRVAMIMISHEMDVLQALCHRIALVRDGAVRRVIETDEHSPATMKAFLMGA